MEDEIDLPELPQTRRLLKRSRPSFDDVNTSSDPIFSSDGPEPSAEDYAPDRTHKRQFKGTWWDSGNPSRRNGISKKVDSGIYMGSDGTDDSLPDICADFGPGSSAEREFAPVVEFQSQAVADSEMTGLTFRSSQPFIPSSQQLPANEEYVRTTGLQCVEYNRDSINLSNLSLECVPSALLDPLQQIIKTPQAEDRAPSPDLYESFAPSLKLFLSGNRLRSVPSAIFNLENLAVLSLRGNKLTELPGSIGKLHNLIELNVANNRLRWLPYELLTLLKKWKKLVRLTLHPNPFVRGLPQPTKEFDPELRIVDSDQRVREPFGLPFGGKANLDKVIPRLREKIEDSDVGSNTNHYRWILRLYEQCQLQIDYLERSASGASILNDFYNFTLPAVACKDRDPIYVSQSKVAFYNADGSLVSNSIRAPSLLPLSTVVVPAYLEKVVALPPGGEHASSVPSLFELALRKCRASPFFADIQALLPGDLPASVSRALQIAADIKGRGDEVCTVCGRQYTIKRTEWIEYWHPWHDGVPQVPELFFIPFLRRGCSWKCVG